jgi:hypothetical protein
MASTHKKVVIRKIGRDSVQGYVAASDFIVGNRVELLNTAGNVVMIDIDEIKGVYFVRDFADANSLHRKTFTTRPRVEGLWVRLRFRDAEMLEGLMPNDLTQVRAEGYFLNPPDTRGNVQRIFIPRSALSELTVLAVIGSAAKRRRQTDSERQATLLFTDVPVE